MKNKKLKTKSSLKIRFRITKTGKVLHMTQNSRHLRRKKRKSSIRGFSVPKELKGKFAAKIRRVMGIRTKKQKAESKKS
ncbi:50S ribosomal protein L35 [Candidatus Collierbacteria bacterium]|nr:50S ribosomal protein L35 [Candidatus Collierbacteria bacterium]